MADIDITLHGAGPAETPPSSPHSSAALGFILVSVLLNALSMGVIFPVFPTLVEGFFHGPANLRAAQAAQQLAAFGIVWALMQLACSPLLGVLSDRFGRRPVLLISMFGLAFDFLLMAVAPSLSWLFVGRIISGITSASGAAAGAYVADVTTPERRARNFGYMAAASGAGIVLGPVLGGLAGQVSVRAPFWLAAGLALVNALYGLLVLRESLAKAGRRPFSWLRANPFGSLRFLASHRSILGLAGVYFLDELASFPLNSIMVLYVTYRFGWGPADLGIILTVMALASIGVQGGAAGPAAARLGDRGAMLTGFALAAGGLAILGLAPNGVVFWIGLFVTVLSGIANPSLQSLLSRRIGADEQGQLQGAMSGLFGVTRLVGPLLFTPVFEWSIREGRWLGLPGLSVLLGAGLFLLAMALTVVAARGNPRAATSTTP
jgi:DHA1 family tetracycline resistance protein-like MFS transporter